MSAWGQIDHVMSSATPGRRRQQRSSSGGFRDQTKSMGPKEIGLVGAVLGVTLHLPSSGSSSPALGALVEAGVVSVESSLEYSNDVLHDGGSNDLIDLRPALPLRFLRESVTLAEPSC